MTAIVFFTTLYQQSERDGYNMFHISEKGRRDGYSVLNSTEEAVVCFSTLRAESWRH